MGYLSVISLQELYSVYTGCFYVAYMGWLEVYQQADIFPKQSGAFPTAGINKIIGSENLHLNLRIDASNMK